VIWVLGGDMDIPSDGERQRDVVRAMAEGLEAGDGGAHLKTFHPYGHRSSAELFHDEEWLDFNMIQSGHSPEPNHPMIEREYARSPVKPVMDAEARYERHPIKFQISNGRFDALDVRQAAYWSLFAGAFGHTYGCNEIWQFWEPGRPAHVDADMVWTKALDSPGAAQMRHAKDLILSRPFLRRIPDQSLIVGENRTDDDHIQATRGEDGGYAFVYLPTGKPVTIDLDRLSGERVIAHWFDPRDGTTQEIRRLDRAGHHTFEPPAGGLDWVLVLEDESRGWPPPGAENLSEAANQASISP
jgi:hypothetical protein